MANFRVTIDREPYSAKPDGKTAGAITNRLKVAEPLTIDSAGFCGLVRQGCTWVPGCYGGSDMQPGNFESLQLCAVDIDNAEEVDGEKRHLVDGEPGFMSRQAAFERCQLFDLEPLCIYETFSSSEEHPRFRIVFDLGEPVTDYKTACDAIACLLAAFPEADQACKNPNRLFFGSNGQVWERPAGGWFE